MSEDSSGRPNQTLADYVTIVLSPVLIMGLVGSLVFFLLEVFYKTDGEWKERLQWILFFFVFGAVLAARMSMQGDGAARAPLYGAVLALLTYIGMQSFVEYPAGVKELSFFVNLVLVGIVWWCAYRLTWDCTNIDEDADMSGEGLLQAAGLEDAVLPPKEEPAREPADAKDAIVKPLSWWERYQRYREQKQKKRTLGVWVVYFSLAALPLFGLGQALIPLTSPDRRQFAFWLMTIYVGCGLGLLLTTCFLGLRRYLRQKRLQMPPAMTGAWLTVGGTLIVLLLAVAALLPRPYSEYPLRDILDPAGSAKRKANRMAFKGDSPGKDKGQRGNPQPGGNAPDDSKNQGRGQGEKDKDGKGAGKDGKDKSEQSGEKGEKDKDGKSGGQGDKPAKDGKGGRANDPAKAAKGMKEMEQRDANQSPSSKMASVQQFLQRIGPILKWLVFAALALIVLVALLRGGLGFLSNFTDWAKRLLAAWNNFWANLFGGTRKEKVGSDEEVVEAVAVKKSVTPFSAFANPFDSGKAARMPARELVRYTFAALEAWARERDLERGEDETALEFVQRLAEEVPALESDAQRLANLHAQAEYARESLPRNTAEVVGAFWERLERVVEAPLSA